MTCKANINILKLIERREAVDSFLYPRSSIDYLQAKSKAELSEIASDLDSFLNDADKIRSIIADAITCKTADKIKAMDYQS